MPISPISRETTLRPNYHFTAEKNWLSDPNGLVHDGRDWHMFYQYNPNGEDWGDMSWGHAISADLASWQELQPALLCDNQQMVFSGSAVMDTAGSAGLGQNAMVGLYTACSRAEPVRQSQALAWSNDGGRSWQQLQSNPVLDLGLADFRDPFVFRHTASQSWIMVVVRSAEQVAEIYRSPDLQNWELASTISGTSAPGRVWECPTLIELPVIGTNRSRWLFKVDALHDAPGSGALYLVGDFDGRNFIPDGNWQVLDHGRDFYAAIAWNGPRDDLGRPAWIGWMGNHAYQARLPKKGWRGVMSLPRRMDLRERGNELHLAQTVEPSVCNLFADPLAMTGNEATVPVACRIDLAGDFHGQLRLGDGGDCHFTVIAENQCWQLQREDKALPFLDARSEMQRSDDGLSLWIDCETIEAISFDGTQCASFQHRPASAALALATDCPECVSIARLR
jgi:sucrose-6-phosphate hydrolase SacC (GH32 family)